MQTFGQNFGIHVSFSTMLILGVYKEPLNVFMMMDMNEHRFLITVLLVLFINWLNLIVLGRL